MSDDVLPFPPPTLSTPQAPASERTSHLFKMCFVDASNLNRFKDALDLSARISEHDLSTLHTLQSASFDAKMNRHAVDGTLGAVLNRAPTADADGTDSADSAGSAAAAAATAADAQLAVGESGLRGTRLAAAAAAQEAATGETPSAVEGGVEGGVKAEPAVNNRRQRGSRGATGAPAGTAGTGTPASSGATGAGTRGNYREWQETNQWNTLVSALTMPRPPTPQVVSVGRTNVSLSWISPFLPLASDTTRFGFNITICSHPQALAVGNTIHEGGSTTTPTTATSSTTSSESAEGEGEVDCKSTSLVRNGPYLREAVDRPRTLQTGATVVRFSATLGDIKPGTAYTVRQTIFYENTESIASAFSRLFLTPPVTVPDAIPRPAEPDATPAAVGVNQTGKKKKNKKAKAPSATVFSGVLVGGLKAMPGDLPTR